MFVVGPRSSAFAQGIGDIPATVREMFDDKEPGIGTPNMRIEHNTYYRLWGGVGGSGGLSKTAPLSVAGGAAFQSYNWVISGAFIHNGGVRRTQPRYSWNEIDAMIGYGTSGRDLLKYGFLPDQLYFSVSAGLAWYDYATFWRFGRGRFGAPPPPDTNASHINSYEWGFGIPIQFQTSYSIVKYVGLGLTLYANINTKRNNYGAMASVVLTYF